MKRVLSAITALVIILTASVFVSGASDAAVITVSTAEALVGDTEISVEVRVTDIPSSGLSGVKVTLGFDPALTVVSVENGTAPGQNMAGPIDAADGYIAGRLSYAWVAGTESVNDDFTLCTVTFAIPEGAEAGTSWEIAVSADADDIFDIDLNNVPFAVQNGSISISDVNVLPGDVNDDGTVNAKDASALAKRLAGWSVEINEANADTNADGTVNAKDLSLLLKYLAGWSVTLG